MCNSFVTPWTIAPQAPVSMGFPRQEYWSGLPFPSPWDFPDPGIEPGLLHCRQILPPEPPPRGKLEYSWVGVGMWVRAQDQANALGSWALSQGLVGSRERRRSLTTSSSWYILNIPSWASIGGFLCLSELHMAGVERGLGLSSAWDTLHLLGRQEDKQD